MNINEFWFLCSKNVHFLLKMDIFRTVDIFRAEASDKSTNTTPAIFAVLTRSSIC